MTLGPLISIITIFWNAEDFLQEAIESVLDQSYENWELLLIDDGSTDGSTAIAHRYCEKYPEKMHYFEHGAHHNLGKSISRNLGIFKAKGKYVTFLDADDTFLPQKLFHQVRILESCPEASMVYGKTLYWYSHSGKSEDCNRDVEGKLGIKANQLFSPPTLLVRYLKDGAIVPCICSLMIRRKTLIELGGFENEIQHMYEDQVLIAKICLNKAVYVLDDCGERYRQHPASSCHHAMVLGDYHPWKPNPSRLDFLEWLAKYISKLDIQDRSLWKVLNRERWPYDPFILYRFLGHFLCLIKRLRVHSEFTIGKLKQYLP